jgi:hypothetical protein
MHKLAVEDLRDWIQAGDSRLELVFVSACHSRSAGEAFLQAGVRHVVCCQRDDQPVLNLSCVLFARAFYQALAHGRLLKDAFALARQQVLCCSQLDRNERRREVAKFVLLPEYGDHNVVIFVPSCSSPLMSRRSNRALRPQSSSVLSTSSNRILPVPTHIFEGRQVELYRVLNALKSARVVRVTGPVGIGKGSVVQRVCRYIQDRRRLFAREIAEILWLPSQGGAQQDDDLSQLITTFSSVFSTTATTASAPTDVFQQCQRQLLSYLHENKVLLVIDARKAQSPQSSSKLASFLNDVVRHTTHTRVICIHHIDASIVQKLPCKERDVHLQPLDFFTTVRLFGKLCQYVTDRRYAGVSTAIELCTLLLPNTNSSTAATDKPRTRRGRDIFQMIGEGIPAKIHHAAKTMSGEEFDHMISLGLRKEHVLEFQSRAALEKELSEVGVEVEKAVEERRFLDAKDCQERLDEMEILRERLHDLPTLTTLAESVVSDQELAIRARDFAAASTLQEELEALKIKIQIEKSAVEKLGFTGGEELELPAEDEKKRETRVELEIQIRKLDSNLEEACDENDFGQARKLDAQIQALKECRSSLPTRDELLGEISELRNSLKQAKDSRDWDLSEALYAKVQDTQNRMDAEIQAQTLLGGDEKKESNVGADKPGAVAVGGLATAAKSPAVDPNGNHANDIVEEQEEGKDHDDDVSTLPVARPIATSNEASINLRPHFRMINLPSNDGSSAEEQTKESADALDSGPNTISQPDVASSPSPITKKASKKPTNLSSIQSMDEAEVGAPEPEELCYSLTEGTEELMRHEEFSMEFPAHDDMDDSYGCAVPLEDREEQPSRLDPPAASGRRMGRAMVARLQGVSRSSAPMASLPGSNGPIPMNVYREDRESRDPNQREYAKYVHAELAPGPSYPAHSLGQGHFFSSAMQPSSYPAPSMGHTNRLVLEQMVQESISNMAIAAVKVEAVDSPPPTRKRAKGKKPGVRTIFGLSKKR